MARKPIPPIDHYRVDVLTELNESSVSALRGFGVTRRFQDGQFVQRRGDPADHALIVLRGQLRSSAHLPNGTEQFIRWIEPGEVTGLSSVLAGVPVPVDLVAKGATELLLLPSHALTEFLLADAHACLVMTRTLSLRVSELFDVVFARAHQSLAERVWATLERLAGENGQLMPGGTLVLHMTQTQLAQAVGASRQRVNDELLKLQQAQKIKLGYRRLEIFKP